MSSYTISRFNIFQNKKKFEGDTHQGTPRKVTKFLRTGDRRLYFLKFRVKYRLSVSYPRRPNMFVKRKFGLKLGAIDVLYVYGVFKEGEEDRSLLRWTFWKIKGLIL